MSTRVGIIAEGPIDLAFRRTKFRGASLVQGTLGLD
jgi:hypothetical protein